MDILQTIVDGLLTQGYNEVGGSDVFRMLRHRHTGQLIKVYYNDYTEKGYVIVRESVEGVDHAS